MNYFSRVIAAFALTGTGNLIAGTSLATQEAFPAGSTSATVPVQIQSDGAVSALQADVLYDPALYDATTAINEADGMLIDSRVLTPGQLRVVLYPQFSATLGNGTAFKVPLTAKTGVVSDFPVVLANFLVIGSDAAPLAAGIAPQVKLLGLKDGQDKAGRAGVELTANARAVAGAVSRVQYFVGGVLVGEGSGANFSFVWFPGVNGPYEITAVALDSNGNVASSRTVPVVISHVGTYAGTIVGTYVGLLRGDPVVHATSGYVTMTSATTGAFTVSLKMGGKAYSGSGKFDTNGLAVVQFTRPLPLPKLSLQLTQSSASTVLQIHGRLTDGIISGATITGSTFVTEFTVDKVVWSSTHKPTTFAGAYTLLMPAATTAPAEKAPLGTGYARMTINTTSGATAFSGKLADGTAISASTTVSKDGRVPFYWAGYPASYPGMISSWLTLRDTPDVSDGDGIINWQRAAYVKAAQFHDGFTTQVPLIASRYVVPAKATRAIPMANVGGNAQVTFEDGALPAPLTRLATMTTTHAVSIPLQGPEKLALKVTASTGLLSGSFIQPGNGKSAAYYGALFQKQNFGSGYFLGGLYGGPVFVESNPQWTLTAADTLPLGTTALPTVSVTAPTAEKTLPAGTSDILISGTAAHTKGIKEVWCHFLHDGVLSSPSLATGTKSWNYHIPVAPGVGGRYTLFVKAVDNLNQQSEVLSRGFWVSLMKPLTIAVTGSGKVTTGFLGTTNREIAKLFTVTATPNSGKKFTGWTGSRESSSPTITFMMSEGFSLTANFTN